MTEPATESTTESIGACDPCLLRGALLSWLSPRIELAVMGSKGSGGARALLALDDHDLAELVAPGEARTLLRRAAREGPGADELRERCRRSGCSTACPHAGPYPEVLREAGAQAPRALFMRGSGLDPAELDPDATVTIVGSRRASPYGRRVAGELGRLLGAAGLTVVSGLAYGIDAEAQRGSLEGGGATVAVLGAGPERPSPRGTRHLYRAVVERGLVLAELPPGSGARRWTFPARNRIMAALGRMTVVVEAAEASGSLITAEIAADYGREVGAVPGPVTAWRSRGTNQLLFDGARMVRDAQDVLDALLGPGARAAEAAGPPLEPELVPILHAVEAGCQTPDAVAAAPGVEPARAGIALAQLELLGYLASDPAGRYSRTPLAAPGSQT